MTLQEPSLYHKIQVGLLLMTSFHDNVGEEPKEKITIGHILFCSLAETGSNIESIGLSETCSQL